MAASTDLESLPGLGPRSREMLARAGITSVAELLALGSVAAFARTRAVNPDVTLNLLWVLEGALSGEAWQSVARRYRTSLLLALEAHEQAAGRH